MIATLTVIWPQSPASAIQLKKQWKAWIDGHTLDCAFAGGTEFSKPAFVDVDSDGDPDLFLGDKYGCIRFFRNEGTPLIPAWSFVSELYDSAIGERSRPAFADIDDDGDPDLFVGNREGKLVLFRNDGTSHFPYFVKADDFYESIQVGSEGSPFFVDIDADSDLDLFVGNGDGRLHFYHNTGTRWVPSWNLLSEYYDSIDVGANNVPFFVDLDADDDFDLFVGEDQGNINFFRNSGRDTLPQWEKASANYNSIDVGRRSAPVFVNVENDSDFDLFVGEEEGGLFFYRNDGSLYLPSWTSVCDDYIFLDLGANSAPALADIDADGDDDLFLGELEGNLNFCRTEENFPDPKWTKVTENYFSIEADDHSIPAFADVDADGDLDLFVGRKDGKIEFYRNTGTPQSALWNLMQDQLSFIDVGGYASPHLADIDGDADLDMFVGQIHGKIYYYRNDGTPQIPLWILVTDQFESIDVGWYGSPTSGDIDLDGDLDLLVGNDEGQIRLYLNQSSTEEFSFIPGSDYDSLDVGERSTPALSDFDSDGDLDLFVGESKGGLHYYKNLTLNSIRGKVSDGANPVAGEMVRLAGDKKDSTLTDSSGSYAFVGLPVANYCVFVNQGLVQFCFSPLESDTVNVNFVQTTLVDDLHQQNTVQSPKLFPNYPNPFNPSTNISYFLPVDVKVKLTIYNLRGERVIDLVNDQQSSGWKRIVWNGQNSDGLKVSSGIYFCKLHAGLTTEIIRMVMLK